MNASLGVEHETRAMDEPVYSWFFLMPSIAVALIIKMARLKDLVRPV